MYHGISIVNKNNLFFIEIMRNISNEISKYFCGSKILRRYSMESSNNWLYYIKVLKSSKALGIPCIYFFN